MPRGPRLDAPGTLLHVIVRGIERRKLVDNDKDRENFVTRMGSIALPKLRKAIALKLINEYGVSLAETSRWLAYRHPVWRRY